MSPIENAIYVVENKTQELRTLISQYQHRQHQGNINPLSMCLNGVIDAAVNGGIARYQEVRLENQPGFTGWPFRTLIVVLLQQAFFDKDYISSHAEDTERITHLKDLMQEQVRNGSELPVSISSNPALPRGLLQVHILGVGLAVHEKLVHPEMRPLHKKLVDQFHMMRTGLHHVSFVGFFFKETFQVGCFVC